MRSNDHRSSDDTRSRGTGRVHGGAAQSARRGGGHGTGELHHSHYPRLRSRGLFRHPVPDQLTRDPPISPRRFWGAVGSAIVGTIAAPLIFELPFDLIVMGRVYSPTPHILFILLSFLPLMLVEISSFAMLTFSPFMSVSRLTLFLLAGMFFLFAVWAVFGFTYASTPLPYACNAISKILAFAVAVSLFLTRQPVDRSQAQPIRESLPNRASAGFV